MSERITMSKIAELCGTSVGTVDRALNNREGINPAMKELIMQTAAELGYRSNKLAGALSRKRKLRIAALYPSGPHEFISCFEQGIKKAESELSAYGVQIESLTFDPQSPYTCGKLLDELDIDRYDAVAINPISASWSEYVDRYTAAGKPVSLFNNDLPGSSRLFYVGGNPLQSGKMGGDIMGTLLHGTGGVAVLGNFVHVMPFFERFDGFCQAIHEYHPNIEIYACADCRMSEELTRKNLVNLLQQMPELRGVFCTGFSSTRDAVRVLEEMGRKDIFVVGYDMCDATADAVRKGFCSVLLYENPYQQAYHAVTFLCRHLLEEWKPQSSQLYIPTRVIFRQNIENYSGGMPRWDELT